MVAAVVNGYLRESTILGYQQSKTHWPRKNPHQPKLLRVFKFWW
jgi:hypothetical protein